MNMMLAIFRKDVRRFWWEITITMGVVAALAWQDINRYDYIPGQMESLLNLLVGAAWAYLIAVVIQQESLVGDKQFWLTRPIPRASLVAAKVLFAVAFIHAPAFIADAVILGVHGLHPLAWLPQLLWKQLVIAGVVTIPAAALASITKNVSQFAVAAFSAVIAAVLLAGPTDAVPWRPEEPLRRGLPLALIAVCGAIVLVNQYRFRRTAAGWIGWCFALLSAGVLYANLPSEPLGPSRSRSGGVSLVYAPEQSRRTPALYRVNSGQQIAIPVKMVGLPPGYQFSVKTSSVTQVSSDSNLSWQIKPYPRYANRPDEFRGTFISAVARPDAAWLYLQSTISGLSSMKGRTIHMRGSLDVDLWRMGEAGSFRMNERAVVPGVGVCSAVNAHGQFPIKESLKVLCESPVAIPVSTPVELRSNTTNRTHTRRLGGAMSQVPYFTSDWLSPLNRRDIYFEIVEQNPGTPGTQWLVPKEDINDATIVISRKDKETAFRVDYDLPNIKVDDYWLP